MTGINLALILLAIVALSAIVVAVVAIAALRREKRATQSRIEQLLVEGPKEIQAARAESLEHSRYSLKGKIAEQLAPLAKGFPYLPSDARFIGSPIDYVVFNGSSALRDGQINADQDY